MALKFLWVATWSAILRRSLSWCPHMASPLGNVQIKPFTSPFATYWLISWRAFYTSIIPPTWLPVESKTMERGFKFMVPRNMVGYLTPIAFEVAALIAHQSIHRSVRYIGCHNLQYLLSFDEAYLGFNGFTKNDLKNYKIFKTVFTTYTVFLCDAFFERERTILEIVG